MKCPTCVGTGRDDFYHLALSECERCNGSGYLQIEDLNPAALKTTSQAYWETQSPSNKVPFDELTPSNQADLSWHTAKVILAYQSHDETSGS